MKSISDIFAKLRSFTRPHPARDWAVIVFVACVVFVVVVVSAGYMFWGIRSGRIVGVGGVETPTTPRVMRGDIQSVIDAYEERKVNFEAENFPVRSFNDPAR